MAPPGKLWLCPGCGKVSATRNGWDADGKSCASPGWDVSCAVHAVLVDEEKLDEVLRRK